MNCLQVMRQARYEADALRAGNTASGMWQDEEVLAALNTSMSRTARLLRLAGSELLTKSILSTDANMDLVSESYDPSSLTWVADQADYTLPADFVSLVSIRAVTSGYEGLTFRASELRDPSFIDQRNIPSEDVAGASDDDASYLYTILGPRTIRFAPTPKDVIDFELVYHYRPARLRYDNTGTITTAASTDVTGASTLWMRLGIQTPADLLPLVDDIHADITIDQYFPAVNAISSNTALTLKRTYTGTTGSAQAYYIAMTPTLPEEHHTWLAQVTAATMLRKVDADLSAKLQADLAQQLLEGVTPEITLRQMQESMIAQAFELPR